MRNIREHGITLIALVITIIILLILAGITLNLALDDDGIINKAMTTGEKYKISEYIDRVEVSKATVMMKNNGKVTLDLLIEQIYEDQIVPKGYITKIDETSAHMVTEEGYNFLIKAEKKAEYIGKEKIETLPEKEEGIIIITGPEWNSEEHTASVTIKKGEGVAEKLEIEYQIDGTNEKGWQKYNGGKIDGLQHGNIIYARLWNGLTGEEYASLQIEDGNKPEATIKLNGTSATVETNVKATVTQTDNESGINIKNCKWAYTNSNEEIGIEDEKIGEYKNSFNESTEELTLESKEAGTYYLHVLSEDTAGNRKETISEEGVIVTSGAMVTYHIDTDNTKQEKIMTGHDCLTPSTIGTPTKNGYNFVGWKDNKDTADANVLEEKIMQTEPIDLYAVFSNQVTLTYYNNTTTPASDTKTAYYNNGTVANPTFTVPKQEEKSSWTPIGYSISEAGNGEATIQAGAQQFSANTTIYGMYEQTITVTTYNGSTNATKLTGKRYFNSGNNATVNPTITVPNQEEKSTWTPIGYSISEAGNGEATIQAGAQQFSANTTIYGMYQRTVKVSYASNGGGGITADSTGIAYYNSNGQTVNASIPLRENSFTKNDGTWIYWAKSLDSSGQRWYAGSIYSGTEDAMFIARWKYNDKIVSVSSVKLSCFWDDDDRTVLYEFDGLETAMYSGFTIDAAVTKWECNDINGMPLSSNVKINDISVRSTKVGDTTEVTDVVGAGGKRFTLTVNSASSITVSGTLVDAELTIYSVKLLGKEMYSYMN